MQDTYEVLSKNKWKIILSFALAGFFVFVITFLIGFNDVVNTLKQANGVLILLNFVLEAGIILIWTLRWKMILDVVDESPKFSTLLMMLFASLFGNNVTPSAAGGEPLRAYLLREVEGTPFELGFASSTADRVFEFLPFVLISIIAALLILSWNIPVITRIIVIAMVFVSIFLFAVVIYAGLKKEIAQRIIISIARSVYPTFIRLTKKDITFVEITEKLIFYVNRFSGGFITALRNRKVFVIGFILSFVMWGLDMLRMYVCFAAVGTYPPVVPLIIIYTIGILISLLPLLPGAWGIREATLIGLFAVVGISADVVLSASLIDRVASYIAPTVIGALAALHYGRKVKNRGIKAKIIEPEGT
jgi:glycosyltransferase 2 family protein